MPNSSKADRKTLLFCSWLAFDPATWAVLEKLSTVYRHSTTVLAPPRVQVGKVYSATGYLAPELVDHSFVDLKLLPLIDDESPTNGFDPASLKSALEGLDPDAIWIYGEPTDGLTRQILKHFYWRRKARIACFLAENLWKRPPLLHRLKSQLLCRRIDAMLACGSISSENAYQVFMPRSVPSHTVFMPNFDPRQIGIGGLKLDKSSQDFLIGFVGRISWEKGWLVLLDALPQLPENAKLVIAGEGPETDKLEGEIRARGLTDRVRLLGALDAANVRALCAQVDVLVAPSLTTPRWREQFGRVIAEGMAAGRPVIGSTSGAIPEVIDSAGLVVEEGDAEVLAAAIRRLFDDEVLRSNLGRKARLRFEQEFSVEAYARRLNAILEGEPLLS